jgi:multisubunit Na+/H+ antiporter MnhB subunit
MNVSVRGLSERVFRPGAPFASVVHAPDLAIPVGLALAIVIAVVTAWRTWPWQRARTDVDRAFAVLLVAALLVSPLGWIYYLPLATAPLLSLAMRRTLSIPGLAGTALVVIALGLLYLPLEVTAKGQPSALATLVLASAHGWGAILLWITLVARPSTERAPELAE